MLVAPLWLIYRVLASRFDIGLTGESDSKLGSPVDVLEYVWHTIGDFGAGWTAATAVIAALAVLGGVVLFRTRPAAVLLAATVLLVPTLALMVARSQSSVFLESRHLIFALPFFQMLVAAGLLRIWPASRARAEAAVVLVGLTALLGVEVAWGWHKTPYMYAGEPAAREQAREEAAAWLAATSRPDDVLFGYEPLYLDAREAGAPFGSVIVPRADPQLAVESLDEAGEAARPRRLGLRRVRPERPEPRQARPSRRPSPGRSSSRARGARSSSSGRRSRCRTRRTSSATPRRSSSRGGPSASATRASTCRPRSPRSAGSRAASGRASSRASRSTRLRVAGGLLEGGEAGRRLALLGTARDAHPAGGGEAGCATDDPSDQEGADPFRALALHVSDCRLLAPDDLHPR